jgi:hypothetical protein
MGILPLIERKVNEGKAQADDEASELTNYCISSGFISTLRFQLVRRTHVIERLLKSFAE